MTFFWFFGLCFRFCFAMKMPMHLASRPLVDFLTEPELLEPPAPSDREGLDRDGAALVLDEEMRRLASQEAQCRAVLGQLAAAFLDRVGHRRLGFARISDYARERLGISGAEMRSAARVSRGLEHLPRLRLAFLRGDVSWSKTRLLVECCDPATEEAWIRRAREVTVRVLAREIKARAVGGEDAVPESGSAAPHSGGDLTPGADEARGRVRADRVVPLVPSPGRTTLPGMPDRFAIDDGLDEIDGEPTIRVRVSCPRRVRRLWRDVLALARCVTGTEGPLTDLVEAIAAEGAASLPVAVTQASRPSRSASAAVDRAAPADDDDALVWEQIREAIPERVTGLAEGAASLSLAELDGRMRAVLSSMQRIAWQTGRMLRTFAGYGLHRAFGYGAIASYVRERLGMCDRKARALIAADRATWRDDALGEAYREGRVGWLRVLTLLPVADEHHGPKWIERAGEVTLRRLRDEVDWALDLQDLDPLGHPVAPPPEDTRLHAPLRRAPERSAGDPAGSPVTLVGSGWQMCAPEPDPSCDVSRPRLFLRPAVGNVGIEGAPSWAGSDTPSSAEVSFTAPASLAALFLDVIELASGAVDPLWVGLERILLVVEAEWRSLPRHRDPVFERDGWRCAVPGCSARRMLQDHHLRFRSQGGTHEQSNRSTTCAAHHLHGIHEGIIRATGHAPDSIVWELGIGEGADGRSAFLTLFGDRYANDAARLRGARPGNGRKAGDGPDASEAA